MFFILKIFWKLLSLIIYGIVIIFIYTSIVDTRMGNPAKYSDDEKAIKIIHRKLQKDPNNHALLFEMGWYMQKRGANAEAVKYYLQCLEVNPRHSPSLVNLGNIYSSNNKPKKAFEYYQKAIRYSPDSSDARYNLGTFYLKSKDYSKALLEFQTVIELDKNKKEAYLNLASIYLTLYRSLKQELFLQKSKSSLLKGLKVAPLYPHIHYNLAIIYEFEDKPEEAVQHYEQAIRFYSKGSLFYRKSLDRLSSIRSHRASKK